MGRKQTSSALPHLPHGMAMPQIQVTGDKPMMPGQKSLPPADWKNNENNQLVPGMDSNVSRHKSSISKQGIPWTDRTSKLQLSSDAEPPPVFSSTPSAAAVIRTARESKTQKQIQRMNGGINPVDLLTTRLESWRLAIKNLVSLFKKIVLVENRTSKGLVGASREIELPFKNSNGQFLENGGIQDVWAALRDYTMQHGILHHESASYIQGSVLPSLRAIKSDIKTMILQVVKDKSLKSNFIYDSRIHVNRLINQLDKTIEADQRSPHAAEQYQDPFLLNLSIIHAIRDLCDHENRLHDNILNLQQETAIFEQKVIENIRHILQNYHDYRIDNKIEDEDFIGNVTETFRQLRPTTEWNNFVQRNKYNLVMENSVYKTEDSVEYPNQKSRFVRASKIGPLQLKTGITKGWTEGIYILTPAGFLHGYKTPKHFQSNPLRPSYSIFVPNSTVASNGDTFEINCNRDKRVSLGASNYVFRAPTRGDNQAWYSYLYGITEEFKTVPLLEKTESNYTTTPFHRDLPPLPSSVLPIASGQERRAIEGPPQSQNRQLGNGEQVNTGQQQERAYIQNNTSGNNQSDYRQENTGNNQSDYRQENTGNNQSDYRQENTGNNQSDYRQENTGNNQSDYRQENTGNNQSDYRQENTGNNQRNYGQENTALDQQHQERAQPVRSDTITGDNRLANITAAGQSATTANLGTQGGDYASGNQTGNYTSGIQTGNNTLNTQNGDYASGNQTGNYSSGLNSEKYESLDKSLNETNDADKYAPTLNTQAKKDTLHSPEGTTDYTDKATSSGIYKNNGFRDKNEYANNNNDQFNSADNLTSDEDVYAGGGKTDRSGVFNQRLSHTEEFGQEHRAVDEPVVSSPTNPHYDIRNHQSKTAEQFDDEDDDSFTLPQHNYHSSKQGEPGL
ncbi:hypothetical protein BDF21DRAFT_451206 [Thamnidium elegans]|uniref:PH domain-containing protein n=1 Tax=Thamnidium elegans TaxID=101142 RepID=A0A8H7VW61_9FUNG|nr:hypothetical protein INT48_000704 [Thamnidium elegans]KAI8083633.1 hypothetical protein BDF21DRAFT_451206 [Thamnidium elegans]